MTVPSRTIRRLVMAAVLSVALPLASAAWGQATPPATPTIPPAAIDALTQAACDPTQLQAAVTGAVTTNPTLAAEITTIAVGQCPADAAGIAAAAAAADPTAAAEIVIAAILALPPNQQQNNAPQIVAAVVLAVPDATDQITTAITALAFNPGPVGTRGNEGAPLVAPHTDVQSSAF
jgi:hypothetical protein